jgi:hypothetical protein
MPPPPTALLRLPQQVIIEASGGIMLDRIAQ